MVKKLIFNFIFFWLFWGLFTGTFFYLYKKFSDVNSVVDFWETLRIFLVGGLFVSLFMTLLQFYEN